MSNYTTTTEECLSLLRQGAEVWGQWRSAKAPGAVINLEHAELEHADLGGSDLRGVSLGWAKLGGSNLGAANLCGADLTNANLSDANLAAADLAGANLFKAVFRGANLYRTSLIGARARRANFYRCDLTKADLSDADLSEAELQLARLVGATMCRTNLENAIMGQANLTAADLRGANLSRCRLIDVVLNGADISSSRVYGTSVWDAQLEGTVQSDLLITTEDQTAITVDDLEVAQFIYLLLNNEKIRTVVDNISRKLVLILGSFSDERKPVLDFIRDQLRAKNYLPVLFDFQSPANRNLTETVSILAHMARFVVADVSCPRSVPQELEHIVKNLPSVPVQPIICAGETPYGMMEHYNNYPWFLDLYTYADIPCIESSLSTRIIAPAERYLAAR